MQYAVITGGTQGIGKATAERFLKEGFSVAVCARSEADLAAVESDWNERFPASSVIAYPADLTQKEDISQFANKVLANFRQVDVLVNNAAYYMPSNLAEEEEGYLEQVLDINLHASYRLTRALLPAMKEHGHGHIFNVSSVAGLKPYPQSGAYGISKYAITGFSDNLRAELSPYNIRVTTLHPGATYTRSWQGSDIDPDRIMPPEDVAEMIWAASSVSRRTIVETIIMRPAKGDV